MLSTVVGYAENLWRTQLGGEVGNRHNDPHNTGPIVPEHCDSTSVVNAIIALVLVIVAIVIAIVTWGIGGIATAVLIGFALALVMATAALVMQVTIVQPGLTDSWNRMMGDIMGMEDAGLESAINNGLGKAVTDSVKVPDYFDQDEDLLFGDPPVGKYPVVDWISRYGAYYTDRLLSIQPKNFDAAYQFKLALQELVYKGSDNFGLYDPLEYLHTWTTLELAKHEVETALRTRELEAQIDTEILKDAEHQRQMILGWALIGLGIVIIAVVIKVLVEYAKIGG
jgi:hypothetical protein